MFIKSKNICTFYIDSGRSTCCYFICFSHDYGHTRVSSSVFSMNSFGGFNGNIMYIGGPQELKTVEIPMRK